MAEAIWVLTRLASPLGQHSFTCSNCKKNVVTSPYTCFTDKGEFDMTSSVKGLLKEYPYCSKCGSKMIKDPQIRAKMAQNRRSEKAYRKYAETYRGPAPEVKDYWKVNEVVVLNEVPF